MCRAIEEMRNDTKIDVYVDSVLSVMKKLKLNLEQAMDVISVPIADREKLIAKINN